MEKLETKTIKVVLEGVADILFDRFIDHSKEDRPPEQKLYLSGENQVVFPSENLTAFLFGDLKPGCAKIFEGKKCKDYIRMGMSHVFFKQGLIPFTKKGKPIVFKNFENGNFYLYESAPATKMSGGGIIKQEAKPRPVLKVEPDPWQLKFDIEYVPNPIIDGTKLYNYFVNGGILLALGSYRPRFGRFIVKTWDEK